MLKYYILLHITLNLLIMKYILNFLVDFINIVNEMSPYLMLGFLFAGILKVLFPQRMIDKYLGSSNNRSVINACLIGIPLPLCSCGVIPTGMSFYKSGASKGASVAFLISTPQTGIDSILVTYSLLGLPFTIIRPFVALITGIIGGTLSNKFEKLSTPEIKINISEENTDSCCTEETKIETKNKSLIETITAILKYAFVDFLQDIAKWLIFGLVLAATISVILPEDFFVEYIANDFVGMVIMLFASIPLYICATSSVPVAAVLMLKGLSPGAALVFLMAGPATNAATITVMNKVMGKKTTAIYLFAITIGALGFGLIIDNFLPREWFSMLDYNSDHLAHQHGGLPIVLQWASSISLMLLILNAYRLKYISSRKHKKPLVKNNKMDFSQLTFVQNKTYIVKGMTCNHCKNSLEKHIGEIKNITKGEVNLQQETLYLEGNNINIEDIKKIIKSLGFEYHGEYTKKVK